MVKQAVIVAGGRGARLGKEGELIPKGLLKIGAEQLVPRSVRLLRAVGIEEIIIGTGHLAEQYEAAFREQRDIHLVAHKRFLETSSMQTLSVTRNYVRGDFLLLESDILYEPRALEAVLRHPEATVVLLSHFTQAGDECYVGHDRQGHLVNISKKPSDIKEMAGELVGINKISWEVFLKICSYWDAHGLDMPKMHYEDALVGVAPAGGIFVHRVDGLVWCEIDTPEHRARAETLIVPALQNIDRVEAGV